MVTQSIGGAPAAAGARRCGKGHAQAAEEDYAEQLARQPELCGRGQNMQGSPRLRPRLRQQQRARRKVKV